MTNTQLTHASQIVNSLEYVEETDGSYGALPSNPTMLAIAEVAKWTPKLDMDKQEFRRLGSEDVFKILAGKNKFDSDIEFGIANSTFIKYGISAINGAGTIAKSLALGFSIKINGTTHYVNLLGSRMKMLKISASPEAPIIKCVATMEHSDITSPAKDDYKGSGSHASAGTAAVWTYTDGGANPITWGGSNVNILAINLQFERALASKFYMGSAKIGNQYPVKRKISGDLTTEFDTTSFEVDMKAGTARNLAWVLKSAVSTLTITNAHLINLTGRDIDADADDSIPQKFGILGESVAVT